MAVRAMMALAAWAVAILAGPIRAVPVQAAAAEGGPSQVGVELNRLEQRDGACRAYLVMDNRTDARFGSFKLDLTLFDADGVVARRMALETGPLRPRKTTVKLFDVDGLGCVGIGRMLVNDVLACEQDDKGALSDCVDLLATSSRAATPLVK